MRQNDFSSPPPLINVDLEIFDALGQLGMPAMARTTEWCHELQHWSKGVGKCLINLCPRLSQFFKILNKVYNKGKISFFLTQ